MIRHRWRAAIAAMLPLALVFLASPRGDLPAKAAEGSVDFVGLLARPWFSEDDAGALTPMVIDPVRRRLIAIHLVGADGSLAEFDLTTGFPEPIRISDGPVISGSTGGANAFSIDAEGGRLFVLHTEIPDNRLHVSTIDLDTLTEAANWDEATTLPGYHATALTYSAKDDLLYLVGTLDGNGTAYFYQEIFGRPTNPKVAIAALDASTGALRWLKYLEDCNQPLTAYGAGGLIGLSAERDVLYTFCASGSVQGLYTPGTQSGLIRVSIDPDASITDALDFPVEFFPVSGSYRGSTQGVTGLQAFDATGERYFVQSRSQATPGAWVFDGLQSAWVGFVAAPDNSNGSIGMNPANGRFYMGGNYTTTNEMEDGWMKVADGRATPVAQGRLFVTPIFGSTIIADPDSDLVFGLARLPAESDDPLAPAVTTGAVWRDTTPPILPLEPVDYDQATNDIDPSDALIVANGGVDGYGVRQTLVGGVEGTASIFGSVGTLAQNQAGISLGDRGTINAFVPSATLGSSGAHASAGAAASDDSTDSDLGTADKQAGGSGDEESAGVRFPYGIAECLDGTGEKVEDSADSDTGEGTASVSCDLASGHVNAAASYDERNTTNGLTVGSSSFETQVFEDPERGRVTQTTTVADGIMYTVAGIGAITFDRVEVTATTAAGGRPGTAAATWRRVVKGARTLDALGNASEPKTCTTTIEAGSPPEQSGDCSDLVDPANELLKTHLKVTFPEPELTATPLGAYAAVKKNDVDYRNDVTVNNDISYAVPGMQMLYTSDTQERSRVLVQFAAVNAYSIYFLVPRPTFEPWPTQPPGDVAPTPPPPALPGQPVTAPVIAAPRAPAADPPAEPVQIVLANHETRLVPVGWFARSRPLRDTALVGTLWFLFALPFIEMIRRRRLLDAIR